MESILSTFPLGFPWKTLDPFLFCVHHDDAYPAGNEHLGPVASLRERNLGNDFEGIDGWRMYHGEVVPGFPAHPHRGFETVTVVRQGFIDHSDSLGAAARFGGGDTQWVTAGKGLQHSEMFPLLNPKAPNPVELFQIWLNLPKADKFADPYFTMLWNEAIPTVKIKDGNGRNIAVTLVAGTYGDTHAPAPPPNSWASRPESDLAIWTLRLDPKAEWTLPPAKPGTNRTLYFFQGKTLRVDGEEVKASIGISLRPDTEVALINGDNPAELLLLQGRPIGEPVAQYGPFVMNTTREIEMAFQDYQRTRFGGWPWPSDDPVHGKTEGRFARYPDGRVEKPGSA